MMTGVIQVTSIHPILIHPGIILVISGFIAMAGPKILRKIMLVLGPLLAFLSTINLHVGMDVDVAFVYGYRLHYLYVDQLSFVFTLAFAIMAVVGGIYACHNENRMEALSCLSYCGSAIGVALAKDWLTLIFFWEALAITSLFLIWCRKTAESRRAGFRYLLVHMFGGNLLLAGIFLKVSSGEWFITNLTAGPHDTAFWLILIGVLTNTACPPLNAWISDAYPQGTLTGTIFLSSFTTKTAVYALIRIFSGTEILMGLGVLMALYGACYAVMENDMRKLLSFHIISQVGFMVAGAGVGSNMALDGATAHAFSDILFKSLLFMCVSIIIYSTGIKYINQLGGMAKKMPIVAICFFIGAFSISGVPFFNGFISKNMTVAASLEAEIHEVFTLLEVASIGTFLSITLKMGYFIFLCPYDDIKIERPAPKNMYAGMILGAVLCTMYGCIPDYLYRHLPYEVTYAPYAPAHVLQFMQMVIVAILPFMMYLNKMEPHTALSLDTDWFYRKLIASMVSGASALFCSLCSALGHAWELLYLTAMGLSANPMELLDARPFRKRKAYDPENYRTAIADPMMITLTILMCVISYLLATIT